jgi:hypothetical protein
MRRYAAASRISPRRCETTARTKPPVLVRFPRLGAHHPPHVHLPRRLPAVGGLRGR